MEVRLDVSDPAVVQEIMADVQASDMTAASIMKILEERQAKGDQLKGVKLVPTDKKAEGEGEER
jgi:hypothetical protein